MTDKEARRILLDIADQMPSDVCADWIDAIGVGVQAIDAQQTKMRNATEEERKSVKNYIESISKPTGVQFDAQLMNAKETIIKSALKGLVKMQIEEGSVGFAVDNDPDHDCCWDDILTWLEAQSCKDCISRGSVIEWLKDKDIIKTKNQEENARRELAELPSVTPSYNSIKTELKSCDDCTVIKKLSKKYYVEDAYGYTDEGIVNKVNEIIDAVNELSSTPQIEPSEDCISREAVDKLSRDLVHVTRDKADFLCNFWEGLNALPSVTPKGVTVTDFADKCKECGKIQKELAEDVVSREAVKALIKRLSFKYYMECGEYIGEDSREVTLINALKFEECFEDLPSVTPQRPKGKWIEIEIDAGEFIYKCSKCGMRVINPYKYCPICGSYNGGGEDEVSD